MDIKVLASSSKGNCYRVSDGKTPLLLEAGISFNEIRKGLGFKVSELAGVLATHGHADHARGLKDMMRAGIDVYTSAGTIEALGLTGHRVQPIRARKQFRVGTWTVLPFEAIHDAAEPVSFLLASTATGEKLIFATDTAYIRYRFTGLTHIAIECNYDLELLRANVAAGVVDKAVKRRVLRSHMSIQTLLGFLRANDLSRVEEIWLLHLSEDNANEAEFKAAVQRTTGKPVYVAKERAQYFNRTGGGTA